jgi:outer membrane protein OmpA-like peptidoglycan-associated protein
MSDDDRVRATTPPRLAVIITATLLGGMIAAVAVVGSSALEAPLTSAARDALREEGISGVAVRFEGREAVLTSLGASAQQLTAAGRVVQAIDGVRWVSIDDASVVAPRAALAVAEDGAGVVSVTGLSGTAAEASAIQDAVRTAFGPAATARITVREGVAVPTWSGSEPELFAALAQVDGVSFALDGDGARVGGSAADPEGVRHRLESVLGTIPLLSTLTQAGPTPAEVAAINGTVIRFGADSVALNAAARRQVTGLAEALRRFPEVQVLLTGHIAIPVGTEADAVAFSLRRATAVAEALVADGIAADRIQVAGAGTAHPVGDNSSASGAAANRRVTVLIEGDG